MNKNLIMLLCILALWLLVIKPLNKNSKQTQNSSTTTTTPKVEEFVDDPSTYPDYDSDASIAVASATKTDATILNAGRSYTV